MKYYEVTLMKTGGYVIDRCVVEEEPTMDDLCKIYPGQGYWFDVILITNTEDIQLDEPTVLKTVACKSVWGPSLPLYGVVAETV